MMKRVAQTLGVILGIWMVWVAVEWRNTLRDIAGDDEAATSAAALRREGPKMAALGLPLPGSEEGERAQLPPSDILPEVPVPPPSLAMTSNEAADKFIEQKRREWGVREYHELRPTTFENPLGTKVKYSAFQDGLPIIGSEITVDVTKDREVSVSENNYQPLKKADLSQPTMDYETILEKSPSKYKMDLSVSAGVSKIIYVAPGSDEPELSYVMAVKENGTGPTENLVFRATDGQVLGRQPGRSEF